MIAAWNLVSLGVVIRTHQTVQVGLRQLEEHGRHTEPKLYVHPSGEHQYKYLLWRYAGEGEIRHE